MGLGTLVPKPTTLLGGRETPTPAPLLFPYEEARDSSVHRATGSSKPPPGSLLSWRVPGTLAWTSIASSSLPCAGTQGSIGCHRTHRALFVWPKTTSNADTQRQQETFSSSVLAELASLDQTLFLRVYIVQISTKDIDSPSTRSITTVAATYRTLL